MIFVYLYSKSKMIDLNLYEQNIFSIYGRWRVYLWKPRWTTQKTKKTFYFFSNRDSNFDRTELISKVWELCKLLKSLFWFLEGSKVTSRDESNNYLVLYFWSIHSWFAWSLRCSDYPNDDGMEAYKVVQCAVNLFSYKFVSLFSMILMFWPVGKKR